MQTSYLEALNLPARYEIDWREVSICAALSAVIAIAIGFHAGPVAAIAGGYLGFVMMLVTIIDHRQFVIPNALSLPAIPLGLAAAGFMEPEYRLYAFVWHAAASFIAGAFLYAVRLIYRKVRGVEGLGMGDVKLAAAAGAWVGLELLAMTCLLSCISAIATLTFSRLWKSAQPVHLKAPIPFGSFIAPATAIMWIFRLLTN